MQKRQPRCRAVQPPHPANGAQALFQPRQAQKFSFLPALPGPTQARVQPSQPLLQAGLPSLRRKPAQALRATRQRFFPAAQLPPPGRGQTFGRQVQPLRQFSTQGPEQLRRMGGRGRAQVRRQVRQGHVHLVPNARQHRQPGVEYGLRHALFIEGPQIFQRTAAADKHNDLRPALRIGFFQRAHQRRRGLRPLHQGREQAYPRPTAPVGRQLPEIVHRRARGRGDQGHALRIPGQPALALRRKIAQSRQLALALLKSLGQKPFSGGLGQLHRKLILPARRVHADAPGAEHVQPVAQKVHGGRPGCVKNLARERIKCLPAPPLPLPEPHALQLRVLIFEAKIDMSGTGPRKVGHLAPHPDKRKAPLQAPAQLFRQLAHAQNDVGHGLSVEE